MRTVLSLFCTQTFRLSFSTVFLFHDLPPVNFVFIFGWLYIWWENYKWLLLLHNMKKHLVSSFGNLVSLAASNICAFKGVENLTSWAAWGCFISYYCTGSCYWFLAKDVFGCCCYIGLFRIISSKLGCFILVVFSASFMYDGFMKFIYVGIYLLK